MSGQALSFVGGFLAIKLLTVFLGPQAYGRFALGLTLAGLCNMFVYGPLSQAVLRLYSVCRERDELPAYFVAADRIYLVVAVAFAGLALVAGTVVWFALDFAWAAVVFAALAVGIVAGTNSYVVMVLSALRKRRAVALFQALDAWLKPLVALVLLLAVGPDAGVALLGFFLATLGVTLVQRAWPGMVRPRNLAAVSADVRRTVQRELLGYAASVGTLSAFGATSAYADRWIALAANGEHDLGVYAAMYQIANAPFVVVVGIITQLIVPVLYDRAGQATGAEALARSDRLLGRTIWIAAVLMAAIVFAAWILARPALLLLTTPEFAGRAELLAPVVFALAIFQLGQLYTLKGMYHNVPSIYFRPKAVQALALAALGLPLAMHYGLAGLVVGLNASSLLYVGAVLLANRRLSPADRVAVSPRPQP